MSLLLSRFARSSAISRSLPVGSAITRSLPVGTFFVPRDFKVNFSEERVELNKEKLDFEKLYSEARAIVFEIRSDPVVLDFGNRLKSLGKNIVLNRQGYPDIFTMEESMIQIKNLLVELFRGALVEVPIKKIEFHNDNFDAKLSRISVAGQGFFPESVNVKFANYTNFEFHKSPTTKTVFKLAISVDQVKPVFRDLKFWFHKKNFPSLEDNGTADLLFEGNGLCAKSVISFAVESGELSRAKLEVLNVDLDKIKINIGTTQKHEFLDTLFAPIVASRVRQRLRSALYAQLETRLLQIVNQLNDWFATAPLESLKMKANESLQETHSKRVAKKSKKSEGQVKKRKSGKRRSSGERDHSRTRSGEHLEKHIEKHSSKKHVTHEKHGDHEKHVVDQADWERHVDHHAPIPAGYPQAYPQSSFVENPNASQFPTLPQVPIGYPYAVYPQAGYPVSSVAREEHGDGAELHKKVKSKKEMKHEGSEHQEKDVSEHKKRRFRT